MKPCILHIVFSVLGLILFSLPGNGLADSGGTDEMAYMLTDRINKARADIKQTLQTRGKNISALLACRPQLKDYIDQGFPRLIPDSRLFVSAASHAADMTNQLYFSKISKNGWTIDDRFLEAGFYSDASDEILGVVLFQNYMSKEKAVDILWKEMLDNELDCGKQPFPILLNPVFRELGISVKSGSMKINGSKVNFYVAVCDFGSDRVSFDEKEMFLLMNKARTAPEILNRLLDPETPYQDTEYAPYRFNTQLYRAAEQLIENRMAEIFHNSGEKDEPLFVRLSDLDYHALSADETSRVWITVDPKSPEEAREHLLKEILAHEADLLDPSERILLNSEFVEAGMALVIQPVVVEGREYYAHALAVVVALPRDSGEPAFACMGTLEGAPPYLQGVFLRIEGKDGLWNCFTDRTGSFSVDLPPGNYRIFSPGKEGIIPVTQFTLTDQNIYVPIDVQTDVQKVGAP
jgi:hypothetical protein